MGPAHDSAYDRPSDSPLTADVSERGHAFAASFLQDLKARHGFRALSIYVLCGIVLGLVLISVLGIGRGDSAAAASPNAITDNIVRLHARDIGESCWAGIDHTGTARLTVAMEVGLDGRVRYAAASGESGPMRGCVEAHARSWEFLPQMAPQTMALPFEVDRR